MAQTFVKDLDPCCCAICLEPLKDPTTISCGHSFCMSCIGGCWDQEEKKEGRCSCPQCRRTFTPRPVLNKNTVLAELVEKFKLMEVRSDAPRLAYAVPGDVECDFCIGRKLKAVKFCLVCLASYCETHIQPHYESAAFQRHKLTEASSKLHENICPQHNRPLEVFCRNDARCICVLCTIDDHRGHNMISVAAARTEKQKQFEEISKKCQRMIGKRSGELLKIKAAFPAYKDAALQAEQYCEQVLRELFQCVQWRHTMVMQKIGDQQVAAASQAEEALEKLETEMAVLRRREEELEKLSQEDDPVYFLQTLPLIPTSYESKDFNAPQLSFELIRKTLSELRSAVEHTFSVAERKVSEKEMKTSRCSAADRAGPQFSVGRIMRHLCTAAPEDHFNTDASVYLATVLEYLTAEIMELSGNAARDNSKKNIAPSHIRQAITKDEELKQFLQRIYISNEEPGGTRATNTNRGKGMKRIRVKPKCKLTV